MYKSIFLTMYEFFYIYKKKDEGKREQLRVKNKVTH